MRVLSALFGPTGNGGALAGMVADRFAAEDEARSAWLDLQVKGRRPPTGQSATARAERAICPECSSPGRHRKGCSRSYTPPAGICRGCRHPLADHRGIVCHGAMPLPGSRCRCSSGGRP